MRRVVAAAAGSALLLSAFPALAEEPVQATAPAPEAAVTPAPATTPAPAPVMPLATTRENTITVAPFSLLGGMLGLEYERVVAPKWSVFAGPSLTFGAGLLSFLGVNGFGVGGHAGGRYFVTGDAPSGLWVGPQVSVNATTLSATVTSGSTSQTSSVNMADFQALGMVGYTWITEGGVDISIGAGGGYRNLALSGSTSGDAGSGTTGPVPFSGFTGALRAAVGFGF